MKNFSNDNCEKWLSKDADGPNKFDDEGYLCDPQNWNETMARCIASRDGFGELTQAHWAISNMVDRSHRVISAILAGWKKTVSITYLRTMLMRPGGLPGYPIREKKPRHTGSSIKIMKAEYNWIAYEAM